MLWCGLLIIKPFYSVKMNSHCHGHTNQAIQPGDKEDFAMGEGTKRGGQAGSLWNAQGHSSRTSHREKRRPKLSSFKLLPAATPSFKCLAQ